MQRQEDLIVGLDIGTTKICAVVGEISGPDINIIGIGTHPSIGLRKGVVINIESTVESIKKAVEEAELMAGCEISSVYAGIAGGHITGFNSRGIVAIKGSGDLRKRCRAGYRCRPGSSDSNGSRSHPCPAPGVYCR